MDVVITDGTIDFNKKLYIDMFIIRPVKINLAIKAVIDKKIIIHTVKYGLQ